MKKSNSWVIKITIITFFLAILMSLFAEFALQHSSLVGASIILLILIFIGVFFDTIGIAVAAANIQPFNSMAAQKVKAAKHSLYLIQNASMVSNFCNDVVGDISGILSGATSSIIILKMLTLNIPFLTKGIMTVTLTAIISSLIVGGKAVGKIVALSHSKEIIKYVGIVLYYIDTIFKLKILE